MIFNIIACFNVMHCISISTFPVRISLEKEEVVLYVSLSPAGGDQKNKTRDIISRVCQNKIVFT